MLASIVPGKVLHTDSQGEARVTERYTWGVFPFRALQGQSGVATLAWLQNFCHKHLAPRLATLSGGGPLGLTWSEALRGAAQGLRHLAESYVNPTDAHVKLGFQRTATILQRAAALVADLPEHAVNDGIWHSAVQAAQAEPQSTRPATRATVVAGAAAAAAAAAGGHFFARDPHVTPPRPHSVRSSASSAAGPVAAGRRRGRAFSH